MKNVLKILFFLMLPALFTVACDDDDDFSSSSSLRLEFSCDTLSFDTLFATIGSPTAVMKAYNRSGSGLRIASVELKNGAESCFRMNVDGQYSDYITDLEIRDDDSLYIFVEVTPAERESDLPFLLSDSICFTLESGVQQYIALVAYGRNARFLHGEVFAADATLSAGHYVIYDSLVVAEGATLNLTEGCRLYFHAGAGMTVKGRLNAVGSAKNPIVFRGDRTDNMFDYLPYDRIPGQWNGLLFTASSNDNTLHHCDIHSAEYGVKIETGDTAVQRLTVQSSRLENFDGNALECVQSRVDVKNSLIANAGGNCVKVVGGSVRFIHCTIAGFYVWKQRDVALALHNSIDGEPAPLREALFANCIITGSKSDELMGYLSDLGDTIANCRNYRFVSSLINTYPDGDENFINVVYDDADVEPFAKEHFKLVDNSVFDYDFHLNEESLARGIASEEFASHLPHDMDGYERMAVGADVGCFQYRPEEDGE